MEKKKKAFNLIIEELLRQHGLGLELHRCTLYDKLQARESHHKSNLT